MESSLSQTLIQNLPDAVLVVDSEEKIIVWNPGAHNVFGYTEQEALGRKCSSLLPSENPQQQRPPFRPEMTRHYQFCTRHRDGQALTVAVVQTPYHDSEGNLLGQIKVAKDVTAKTANDRLLA